MKNPTIISVLMLSAIFIWAGCDSGMEITGPGKGSGDASAMGSNASGRMGSRDRDAGYGLSQSEVSTSSARDRDNGMMGHYTETLIPRETGGTLVFRNGRLDVPPMSIDSTKVIGARTYSLERYDFFKKIYEFEPSGTVFDPPATLTLNYCDLGPLVPDSIILRVFNEETQQWEIASYMVNDPVSQTFTGTIGHFSRYSLSGNGQVLRPQTP